MKKTVLFKIALAVLAVFSAESLSYISLAVVKADFSPVGISKAGRSEVSGAREFKSSKEIYLPDWMQAEILHPYIGFTQKPSESDPFGFQNDVSSVQKKQPGRYIVAITGGSVAWQLDIFQADTLERELRRTPGLENREIVLIRLAAGGVKQPQQLMALNYLLSIGAEFDLVINLDGFNEIALGSAENAPQRVFPVYPRNWFVRLGSHSIPSLKISMTAGLLCRKLRLGFTRFFSRSVIENSAFFNLVWEIADHVFQRLITLANAAAHGYSPKELDPELAGPGLKFSGTEHLYEYIAMNWAKSSLLMSQICRANGARYIHFLQPNQHVPGSKKLTAEEKTLADTLKAPYRNAVVLGYPVMQRAAKTTLEKADFHDLTRVFAREEQTLYTDSCCHLNLKGYEMLALEIGAAVRKSLADSLIADTPALNN